MSTSARRPWAALQVRPGGRSERGGGDLAGRPSLPLPCRGRPAPSAGALFSNSRATGGAFGPRESPTAPRGERQLLSPIRARGRAWRGRADAGDQWDSGSGAGREGWAWSESGTKVSRAATARASWSAKLSGRGVLVRPGVEKPSNVFSFGPTLQFRR